MKDKPTKPKPKVKAKASAEAGTAKLDKTPGGGGARKRRSPQPQMDSASEKKLAMSTPSIVAGQERFSWQCPECGTIAAWEKPWHPEGRGALFRRCPAGGCKKQTGPWFWFAGAGWHRTRTEEENDGHGLPRLDANCRWLFLCECGAVHRPKDTAQRRDETGDLHYSDIEPDVFPLTCNCGRDREFRMDEGKWKQARFNHRKVPEPNPEQPIAQESEDGLPVLACFNCEHCGEALKVTAGFRAVENCKRCGWRNSRDRKEYFQCDKCTKPFLFPSRHIKHGARCPRCNESKAISSTGEILWECTPTTAGCPMTSKQVEALLFGSTMGTGQVGLYQAYMNGDSHRKAVLGFEARLIADAVLKLMTNLAVEHEDYHAVRWLASHADLGKCRFPDDWHENLERQLTDDTRPKAKREWAEVREWASNAQKGKSSGRKTFSSKLFTLFDRLTYQAQWLKVKVTMRRQAEQNPRMQFPGDPRQEEAQIWLNFLKAWNIEKPAKMPESKFLTQVPLPEAFLASHDSTEQTQALMNEILVPLVRRIKRVKGAAWKEDGYPKCDSDAELKSEVRRFLKLSPDRPTKEKTREH
jgi:hypothetical protein